MRSIFPNQNIMVDLKETKSPTRMASKQLGSRLRGLMLDVVGGKKIDEVLS